MVIKTTETERKLEYNEITGLWQVRNKKENRIVYVTYSREKAVYFTVYGEQKKETKRNKKERIAVHCEYDEHGLKKG